jgi:hypothetical protein
MNGLVMAVRRGRIDLERVARFARALAALPIRIEPPHTPAAWDAVIRVATKHQLTVYDAAYLEPPNGSACPSPLSTAIYERRRWPQALFWSKHEHPMASSPEGALQAAMHSLVFDRSSVQVGLRISQRRLLGPEHCG